jgi:hypothetical protein
VKRLTAFALWIAISVFNWGACMADLDWDNHHEFAIMHWGPRHQLGIVAFESIAGPFGLPVALFATNFLEHGWMLWGTQA